MFETLIGPRAGRSGQAASWGDLDLHGEGTIPLAGPGTPEVAEFAPAVLAAHLRITLDAGKQLIADALELRHRLPRLWDLVHAGDLPAWRARQVAALTTHLTTETALWADRMLACDHQHLTATRARRVIEDALLFFDPDRATADEQHALDALSFDDTLADLANTLGRLGPGVLTIRPVLNLHRDEARNAHCPPTWMRQAALLRDATCVFPSCTRESRHCDLDHINAYVPITQGGPPGQTSLANLAPLCRSHHRLETHTTWTYQRTGDNHYLWTTPVGDLLAVRTRPRRT